MAENEHHAASDCTHHQHHRRAVSARAVMIGTKREPLYKIGDVPSSSFEDKDFARVARFPHLNAEQYLSACEEANFTPPFLIGK